MICENRPHDIGTLINTDQRQHITSVSHRGRGFCSATGVKDFTTSTRNSEITTVSL